MCRLGESHVDGLFRVRGAAEDEALSLQVVQIAPGLGLVSAVAVSGQIVEVNDAKGSDIGQTLQFGVTENAGSFAVRVEMLAAASLRR
jgi:hypothetical protein